MSWTIGSLNVLECDASLPNIKNVEGVVLWTKDVKVWWVKLCNSTFAWLWHLDVNQGMFKLCMKSNSKIVLNHHLVSIHWFTFGGPFIHLCFGECKEWTIFFISSISKEQTTGYLIPSPTVCGHNHKFFTLKIFLDIAIFDAWIGMLLHLMLGLEQQIIMVLLHR